MRSGECPSGEYGFSFGPSVTQDRQGSPIAEIETEISSQLKGFDRKNPEAMELPEFMQQERNVVRLFEKFDAAKLWDALIKNGLDPEAVKQAEQEKTPYPKSYVARAQIHHTEIIESNERGDEGEYTGNTFGLYEPAYDEMLEPEKVKLAHRDRLDTLLLGSQSKHSANEYADYVSKLNRNVSPAVIDIEEYGMRGAVDQLKKIKGDAADMPIESGTQDIVFTNFLIHALCDKYSNGYFASGEKIMAVLSEAYRVLKDDGIFLMAEMSPADRRDNSVDWLSLMFLQASLTKVGFSGVEESEPLFYMNHIAKLRKDEASVERDVRHSRIFDGREYLNVPETFCFMAKAKKLADRGVEIQN